MMLDAAAAIGDAICAKAVWSEDGRFCNWMGRIDEPAPEGGTIPATSALPPQMYTGSLGIALFLGELWAFSRDDRHGRTALAALRRSSDQLLRRPPARNLVLSPVGGTFGIVAVAFRLRDLGFGEEVLADVRDVLDRVRLSLAAPHQLDLLGGNAGAIPLFLALAERSGYETWRAVALELGEELLAKATRDGDVLWWEPKTASDWGEDAEPLAGFSHGASGYALALLSLAAATGEQRFADAVAAAFAWEETRWDAAAASYIYARNAVPGDPSTRTVSTQMSWCHGSPGVAMARLRASELDAANAALHRAVARKALQATASRLEALLETPRADACLCHGIAGLCEALLYGAEVLGEAEWRAHAQAGAQALIARHGAAGDWPSGVPSLGPNPSLFVGSAGAGHHFLRQHAGRLVPPVLVGTPVSQ
jgi:lantibiotic modifying enzyme